MTNETKPAPLQQGEYPGLPQGDVNTGVGEMWNRHSMRAYVDADRAAREAAHSDFVETIGLMLDAIGYTEEYAKQWPKEKASVTFKRWFDAQLSAAQAAPALTDDQIEAVYSYMNRRIFEGRKPCYAEVRSMLKMASPAPVAEDADPIVWTPADEKRLDDALAARAMRRAQAAQPEGGA